MNFTKSKQVFLGTFKHTTSLRDIHIFWVEKIRLIMVGVEEVGGVMGGNGLYLGQNEPELIFMC